MNYRISSSQTKVQNLITPEELNQILEAVADGRYSWACVLILRFIGYNPLHYIPQRTYSRLMKENSQIETALASTNKPKPHPVNSSHCVP
ncbi:HetP family heterocyst commitment protein [Trichormus azollae]|uniref:HetP family heterocyst commitment protein n=1 Tax=Trichormus azollae TaxID=1164 RepID=UPI00325EAFC3